MPASPEREWIDHARIDLDSAEVLAQHGGHADTICFLCQQAVEKVLKAMIVAGGQPAPKIHALLALSQRLAHAPWLVTFREELAFLSECYLSSRYPTLDPEQRTHEEADRALRIAREVFARVGAPQP